MVVGREGGGAEGHQVVLVLQQLVGEHPVAVVLGRLEPLPAVGLEEQVDGPCLKRGREGGREGRREERREERDGREGRREGGREGGRGIT